MDLYIGITTKLYVYYFQNGSPFYIRVSSGRQANPRVQKGQEFYKLLLR